MSKLRQLPLPDVPFCFWPSFFLNILANVGIVSVFGQESTVVSHVTSRFNLRVFEALDSEKGSKTEISSASDAFFLALSHSGMGSA